jgi:hypothetical protein
VKAANSEDEMSERDEAAKAFAIELVQLARKHGANCLNMTFDMTGETRDWRARSEWDHGAIRLSWKNGRHGAKERIWLRYEANVSLLEADPTPSTQEHSNDRG